MSVNALIAQGVRPIGADLPEIGNMLYQRKAQDAETARRNELLGLEKQRIEAISRRETAAQQQQLAEEERQWIANAAIELGDAATDPQAFMSARSAFLADPRAQQIMGKLGVTPEQVTPENVTSLAGQIRMAYGIERPEQPVPFEQSNEYRLEQLRQQGRERQARLEAGLRPASEAGGLGKPPAGFRWRQDGSLEPIPGGPADPKGGPDAVKTTQRAENAAAAAENVLSAISDARALIGRGTAGFGSENAAKAGYEPAVNLRSQLETVRANLGFDRLQQMRESSPTGGALGQVAVQELVALQSTVASLDPRQSPEQLRRNLDKIEKHYTNWLAVMREAAAGGSYLDQTRPSTGGGWSIEPVE